MLSAEGQKYMLEQPWLVFWSSMALAIVIYGINMLGVAMRDLLDPDCAAMQAAWVCRRNAINKKGKSIWKKWRLPFSELFYYPILR